MARPEKIRLGDLLIQQGLMTEEQLKFALDEQKRTGRKLGRIVPSRAPGSRRAGCRRPHR